MKKYEYKKVRDVLNVVELNEYGDQGWKLISVTQIDNGYNICHYFIREIEQIQKEWWPDADGTIGYKED